MPLWYYQVKQSRPDVHPHNPFDLVELPTENIDEAIGMIRAQVLQFDIGDEGDELTVYQIGISKQTLV